MFYPLHTQSINVRKLQQEISKVVFDLKSNNRCMIMENITCLNNEISRMLAGWKTPL